MISFSKLITAVTMIVSASAPLPAQDTGSPLAKKVMGILRVHCGSCHADKSEGGIDYILDAKQLVDRGKVVPGKPKRSRLLTRMKDADSPMPPEGVSPRPTADEIELISSWIKDGALDSETAPAPAGREFIPPAVTLKQVHDDLMAAPARDRVFLRYFTLTHLHNLGVSDEELQTHRWAVSKLVNSLSWKRRLAVPHVVDAAGTLLRIDLRDYAWNESTWNGILASYPFGITYGNPDEKVVAEATQTKLAAVRADWFIFMASRPPLYHELLRIPNTDRELEKFLDVNVAEDVRVDRVMRAGFNGSGVAHHNRLLQRHDTAHGAYWKSFDVSSSLGRQNLFEHPFGPERGKKAFEHHAGEIIYSLANGLDGYMIVDSRGQRIDKAATELVTDPRRKDRIVVNGISCFGCHKAGIIPKDDQIRAHVQSNGGAFDDAEKAAIFALHPPPERLKEVVAEDSSRFRKAVNAVLGRPSDAPPIEPEPIVAAARRFERDLTQAEVAAELYVSPDAVLKVIDETPALARVFGAIKIEGGTVNRDLFVKHFKALADALHKGSSARAMSSAEPSDSRETSVLPSGSTRKTASASSGVPIGGWVIGGAGVFVIGAIGAIGARVSGKARAVT